MNIGKAGGKFIMQAGFLEYGTPWKRRGLRKTAMETRPIEGRIAHLERWKATIGRKSYDRLPRFYLGTGEFTESLKAYLGEELDAILYDRFRIDYRFQGSGMEGKSWEPEYIGPEPRKYEDGTFENIWGSRQKLMYYSDGRGAYTETFKYALGEAQSAAEVDRHPAARGMVRLLQRAARDPGLP
jgi:hypothetical protein